MREAKGRVVILNGASSSGKTSIGQALLSQLPGPWFLVPVDAFGAMRSTSHTDALNDADLAEVLKRTRLGYHRAVAGLASAGNDVVMDYPLSEWWRLDDLLDVLGGYDVTLVEVRCSSEELARREHARGDRTVGLAQSQGAVYELGDRDILVDTTRATPAACAAQIAELLGSLNKLKAFDRFRRHA
ncbi:MULTISPECIES: chloramphenicol phosphotransferase CPT family protein [Nocardioides]|uniref:chloramphenicol phosphotransferase CPT family protein n=1 Tax=Nocardioides TaxID=1839 RepID=UPI00055C9BFA|nr:MULTISPECIES: AAA family ATPase [Nocardioides]